ncbi:MAG: NADH-quinone oxidoreductase subunit J [Anaerolineales bacterium]|nr:NADH-quinone oxidoreductase subunit J [Anaerolineales bacterium]
MTFPQLIFWVTAAVILASALQVVTTRNIVHAALWLIVTFFGVAVLFVLLDAGFLAAVQVVVYIGAIAILIIFAVMLTRRVMQDTGSQTNRHLIAPAVLIGGVLFVALLFVFSRTRWPLSSAAVPPDSLQILGLELTSPDFYMTALVTVGVLLAAAMVGSIAIARDEEKD